VLATSHSNTQLSTDRSLKEPLPLIYAAFLLDDIAHDFNQIVWPEMAFDERNDSMMVSVTDTLHGYNHTRDISVYGMFISNEVASRTASNISANFTNLTGGVMRLFIDEDYVYTNDHGNSTSLFTRSGGTDVSAYYVNVTVTAVRANITHMAFDDNGTMNVSIRYTDVNGTSVEEGRVFPVQQSTLRLDYAAGGSLAITVGPSSGADGSLRMQATGTEATTSWAAVLPPQNATKKVGYEYDATIAYSQGKVGKRCRIGK
jgi:hypothetical protein